MTTGGLPPAWRARFTGAAWALLTAAIVVLGGSGVVQAQGSLLQHTTPWASLTPGQREALAPLERGWASTDAANQQKWLEIAARFPTIAPTERERIQRRMAGWAQMTPQERGQARINFQELRQHTGADERQSRWEAYQALPESQRRELASRAALSARAHAAPSSAQAARTQVETKSSVVKAPAPTARPRPVSPAVVQAGPGASTTLVTKPATPPLHQQAGLPKMAAKPGFVDPKTLLPKRGMQGAAVVTQAPPGLAPAPAKQP